MKAAHDAARGELLNLPEASTLEAEVVTPERVRNDTLATATKLDIKPNAVAGALPYFASSGAQSISPAGDEDYYSFTVRSGFSFTLQAYVDTGGAQNTGGGSRDSVLTLFDSSGTTMLAEDDDDGTCNDGDDTIESLTGSAIQARLTSDTTYYLRVAHFNNSGIINPYRLFVVVEDSGAVTETNAANDAAAPRRSSTP